MTTLKQLPTVDVGSGTSINVVSQKKALSVQVDDVGGTVLYIGEATAGTATSSGSWRIKKVTFTGDDVSIQWAASGEFALVWDNRLSYTYS
jgi:hypothetical protein